MTTIATVRTRLIAVLQGHQAELRLGVRVTASAVLTLVVGQWLEVPLVLWAVLTAVIVTQTSVGRSLKATLDYFIGTLGGAIYAGAVAALIPHASELALLGVLALAVAPLVLLASINSSFNVAPFTAIIVVLAPTITHSTPIESAFYRLIEVALGALMGLLVSLTVFPARAQALAIESSARMLELVAQVLPDMFAGFTGALDPAAILPLQERVGKSIARLDVIYAECKRERMTQLAYEPDPGPLVRTLLRLRHDLVIVGRAAVVPLPQALQPRLGPPLQRLVAAIGGLPARLRRRPPGAGGAADARSGGRGLRRLRGRDRRDPPRRPHARAARRRAGAPFYARLRARGAASAFPGPGTVGGRMGAARQGRAPEN